MEQREILFRGQTEDGKWMYGDLIQYASGERAIISNPFSKYGHELTQIYKLGRVKPETITQFTCLYDSTKWEDLTEEEREEWTRPGRLPSQWKGEMIFEGDIQEIEVYHCANVPDSWITVVQYDVINTRWCWRDVEYGAVFDSGHSIASKITIGDKFNNPELLKPQCKNDA